MRDKRCAQNHRHCVAYLLAGRHEAACENKAVRERLNAGSLTHRDTMIFYRMDETSFRWIDAGRCHRWRGKSRIDPAVYVFVAVMYFVAPQRSSTVPPASAVSWGLAKRLN